MKFLLDSQISGRAANWLRKEGHDVREVRGDPMLLGASDLALVEAAWREGRVLVSAVSAFVHLVSPKHGFRPGAVLLLAGDPRPQAQIQVLQAILRQLPENKLIHSLTVIEGHRARVYPLFAQPPEQVTPESQPRPAQPPPSPTVSLASSHPLACPVCGYTMKPLHGCKQVCAACGYLSTCGMY